MRLLKKRQTIPLIVLLLLFSIPAICKAHTLSRKSSNQDQAVNRRTQNKAFLSMNVVRIASAPDTSKGVAAPFEAFPNLHMLFVHFPAVLLIVALVFQILSFLIDKQGMDLATLILLVLGWLGALLAAFVFHPHVAELPERIRKVFEAHEFYAYWTVGLSSVALVLKATTYFLFVKKKWLKWITLLFMAATVYTLASAGHLGSQLVYIEGVGPKGQYIERHHGSEQH